MIETLLSLLFWAALLIVLLTALALLLATYARQRRLDRALQTFEDYFVTVERMDGRTWSGVLKQTGTGFEICYPTCERVADPPFEASYIHYAVEYGDLQAIYRDIEGLSENERRRRQDDLQRSFEPDAGEKRRLRFHRWLNRISDTVADALAAVAERPEPLKAIENPQDGAPPALRHNPLIGYTGNHYDPIIERCLGDRVVCQIVSGGICYERGATLLTYSDRFLALVDALFPQQRILSLSRETPMVEEAHVRMELEGRRLQITNLNIYPLLLDRVERGDRRKELGMMLEPKGSFSLTLDADNEEPCELHCQVVRKLDLIVPREHALIRYRVARDDSRYLFDIGIALAPPPEESDEEEKLRWELKQHPRNAMAAASLGRLLYRKGDLAGAEVYFKQALENARSLPDNGRRVSEELAQLQQQQKSLPGVRA